MNEFLKSFFYALRGVRTSISEQRNLKIQLVTALIVVAAGLYFRISAVDWSILLLTISLVIGFEMINSSIEDLVDLVTTEWKPLAGKVKDIVAGAVLFVSLVAMVIGIIVFGKYVNTESF